MPGLPSVPYLCIRVRRISADQRRRGVTVVTPDVLVLGQPGRALALLLALAMAARRHRHHAASAGHTGVSGTRAEAAGARTAEPTGTRTAQAASSAPERVTAESSTTEAAPTEATAPTTWMESGQAAAAATAAAAAAGM